ncbi:MAG: FitA-like ribbon-helix-helix domain-containing protein [Coriobacteriia bacterium]
MPDVLIRDVPEDLVAKLKERAANNKHSLQVELMSVLHAAAKPTLAEWWVKADEFRERSKAWNIIDDSTDLIREDRDSR